MTSSTRRAALLSAAFGLVLLLLPQTGFAQAETQPILQTRRIDATATDAVHVAFQYDGDPTGVAALKATENGKQLKDITVTPLADAKLTNNVVFMVDSSSSTDLSAVLAEARGAITTLSAALPGAQMALVTAGADVAVVQRFTPSAAEIAAGLATLTPAGEGGLWAGVVRAASQFNDVPGAIPTIVLVTDGNTGKGVSYDDAVSAVNDAGAQVITLAVSGAEGGLGSEPRSIAEESGGTYHETAKAADLTTMAKALEPQLLGQYAFSYPPAKTEGVNDLTLELAGSSTHNSYVAGSVNTGVTALAYQAPAGRSGLQFLQNDFGKVLGVLLGVGAIGLAAYALLSVLVKDDGLSNALQPYADGYVARSGGDDDDGGRQGMAQTPIMQRAVDLTEQLAKRQGLLTKVEIALERADLPLRAAEAIFFYFAAMLVIGLLIAVLASPFAALVAFAAAALLAPGILTVMSERRRRAFESMLPDTLQLLSGTLRAGYSMMQGVEAVSQEVAEPMGRELRRVVTEARLGRQLEDSLDAVADRMGSNDFRWATMAIRIQREVGGNLSELLMTVADTMTQRERLRRDVKSLTAEGRMSAYVLAVLPPGIAVVMYVLNPEYSAKLTDSAFGLTLLGVAGTLMVVGFLWMNRIVKIDI